MVENSNLNFIMCATYQLLRKLQKQSRLKMKMPIITQQRLGLNNTESGSRGLYIQSWFSPAKQQRHSLELRQRWKKQMDWKSCAACRISNSSSLPLDYSN